MLIYMTAFAYPDRKTALPRATPAGQRRLRTLALMQAAEASVALYWDFENIHASAMKIKFGDSWFQRMKDRKIRMEDTAVLDVAAIMQYASTLGEVIINKAYANWTNFWPYAEPLNEYAMDLIQLFPLGINAKNGADIRLSLDIAEDLVLQPHIDVVLLVSGDSDFISIAQRVRRNHKRIVGLGVKEASNRYWQMSCNEFKLYRTLIKQYGNKPLDDEEDDAEGDDVAYALVEDPGEAPAEDPKSASAKTSKRGAGSKLSPERQLLKQAIENLESRDGDPWVKRRRLKPMMQRLDPAFDEANHGYPNFTAFLEDATDLLEIQENNSDMLVRVKKGRGRGRRRK